MAQFLFDGAKAVSLESLPESAWVTLGGETAESTLETLGNAVAFLFRCVELRANALTALPWQIESAPSPTTGEDEADAEPVWESEDEDPPAQLEYLADLPTLLWQSAVSWCFKSEAFWHVERNRVRIRGVRWLDPDSMTPLWDPARGLVGFERRLNNKKLVMPPDEIVYLWRQGLRETKPATPPAQAGAQAAGVLYNADGFAARFFERGAIKATLLTVEGNPSGDELKKLESWWKRFFSGSKDAWATAAVRAGVTAVPVGEGLESLSNAELTTARREDIATALGTPASLVMANAANFATAQQDERNFYNLTIIPDALLLQRQMNRQLFAPLGLRFKFKPQEHSAFQADENERSAAFKNYVDAGLTLGVAAEMLGLYLPEGVSYDDLDEMKPEPPPPVMVQPGLPKPGEPATNGNRAAEEAAAEEKAFRRWLKKRPGRDVAEFHTDYLSRARLDAIAAELGAQGSETPDPFRLAGWGDYP